MAEPLADRLLDVLGDHIARAAIRLLLERELSQADLIKELGIAQATASRALKVLRAAGLVVPVSDGRGQRFTVSASKQAVGVFLAVDRLAEQILEEELVAQRGRSRQTRRTAMKPADQSTDKIA